MIHNAFKICVYLVIWLFFSGAARSWGDGGIPGRHALRQEERSVNTDADFWSVVEQRYREAKTAGRTTASSAAQWVGQLVSQTTNRGKTSTQQSADWVRRWYSTLRQTGVTSADNVTDWVIEDLRGQGTWQYKVHTLPLVELPDFERQLDEMGSRRWECFQVVLRDDSAILFLKRSRRSYLGSMPIKEMTQILPLLDGDWSQ